ncbi:ribosomal-protein-alanine N-acetyltransferase [Acetobacter ascendens]|uniref:[Ribosomal protein bS18]-alanine N-acetyltransferase n=1 Tax=Acetobacter ascendens TaxID=481146 RepID=A0A1D8QYK4_9PROT|nr:ribosomal-protein-alanine N-acetyltransferase [Acetobacter ascendens]AOW48675.1 ribosomal-protein-alanine N-acetyltransferase [Acetobacter ascendens]RCL08924.1 ribosomal-protein-alanine N-acetyltransferase [Acetobacter pasteurianus]GCD76238.1 ribosomal protein alanine acetyltransferase [Acetobacter pasteurianus NBRC 3299]
MTVHVQEVGIAYAPLLASMHTQCFNTGAQWDQTAITALLSSPGVYAGIVIMESHPAGFIILRSVVDEAEILTVCILPEYRKRGLAQRLLAWCAQVAQHKGAQTLFLEVSINNQSARTLYEKQGFKKLGLRKKYYEDGSDALVLGRACQAASP